MIGKKVYVYFNLHKSCWSVKDYKTNRVIAHVESIKLDNVEFRVRQGGRERVVKDKSKNVHAFVIGEILSYNEDQRDFQKKAMYNPYAFNSFMDRKSVKPIFSANTAYLNNKRKVSYN